MKEITPRQAEILRFIQDFIGDRGFPPTRVEIAKALGFRSANAAEEHLRALERKEAVELLPGASRGIRLLLEEEGLPVVGKVAVGKPILEKQHIEDHYAINPALFRPRASFLLRVRGMSMRNAGIFHRDLLAVHATHKVRSGQVVVVRLEGEIIIRRLRRRGNQIRLLPENADFEPIEVNLREQPLSIEGVGVGILRNHRPL
jgi:repressor LexA